MTARAIEDLCNLFQSATLRFRNPEVDCEHHDEQDGAENDVVSPAQVFHGDWIEELSADEAEICSDKVDRHSSASQGIREDLGGVRDGQRSPGNVVEEIVDEDESQDRASQPLIVGLRKLGVQHRPSNVGKKHAGRANQEQRTATNAVDQEGAAADRHDPVEDLQHTIDECLMGRRRDSNGVENEGQVIGQDAAAIPLGEKRDEKSQRRAMAVGTSSDQLEVAGRVLAGLFQFQRLGDFIQLELDQGRIFIATRVVFGQDTPGFFFLLIGHEPPGLVSNGAAACVGTTDRRDFGTQKTKAV